VRISSSDRGLILADAEGRSGDGTPITFCGESNKIREEREGRREGREQEERRKKKAGRRGKQSL
jgi:hypothetical protein